MKNSSMKMIINKKYTLALKNIGYLGVLKICNSIFPFVSYPYLIKTLGSEQYGEIIYYEGIAIFFAVFVSYGFNLSATRDISNCRGDINKVSYEFYNVLITKLIILSPVYVLYILIGYIFFNDNLKLYMLCSGPLISEFLFPLWFYQGMEKLKNSSILTVMFRFLLLLSILFLIKEKNDNIDYAYLLMMYHISYGSVTILYIIFKFKIWSYIPNNIKIKKTLRSGFSVFLSTMLTAVKDRLNVIIVGSFLGHSEVVLFDFSSKLLSAISLPQNIIINSFFSTISKEKSIHLFKKITFYINVLNTPIFIISCIFIWFFSSLFFTYNNHELIAMMIIMLAVLPLGVSSSISRLYLLPFGHDAILARITFINSSLYLIIILSYLYISKELSIVNFSILILVTYFIELLIRVFAYLKVSDCEN